MQKFTLCFVLTAVVSGWSQIPQSASHATRASQTFDGKWWSTTSTDEHQGFLDGADDCLTWTAHKPLWPRNQKGFGGTWQELNNAIERFYKDHPELNGLSVIDVWKRVIDQSSQKALTGSENAETWKSPHWYMDGFWWTDETQDQKRGFIKGYLWCMKTQVPAAAETYSKPVGFYVDKIDAFTKANGDSRANREKVASILRRFRDRKER